jgi:hypothetical protein
LLFCSGQLALLTAKLSLGSSVLPILLSGHLDRIYYPPKGSRRSGSSACERVSWNFEELVRALEGTIYEMLNLSRSSPIRDQAEAISQSTSMLSPTIDSPQYIEWQQRQTREHAELKNQPFKNKGCHDA